HAGWTVEGMPMTEAEWLACAEPERMLVRLLTMGCLESNRKVGLLIYACSRRVWAWLDDDDRQDLEAFAAYADGLMASEPDGVPRVTRTSSCVHDLCVPLNYYRDVAEYSRVTGEGQGTPTSIGREELVGQASLVREVFGNPFHPSPELPTAVLGWSNRTVP